jgi:putative ABC transport system ATP-binding protein
MKEGRRDGRVLANRPPLILAGEPTASLVTDRGMKAMALPKRVAPEQYAAVIAVAHNTRSIAGFDTTFRVSNGRLERADANGVAA